MIVTEILSVCLVLIFINLLWSNRRFIYLMSKIPSSSYDVSIRHILAILGDTKVLFKNIREELEGKGLTATFIGSMVTINVLIPEDVKIVLNSRECVGKPNFFPKFFIGASKGSLFGTVETWQSHRKILNPFFGLQSLRSMIPIFNTKVAILMANLGKMKDQGEFDVFHYMTALTLETILSVMEFDRDFQNQEAKSRDAFITNLERYMNVLTLRIMRFWLHPNFIFNRSSLSKIAKKASSNCAMVLTPDVIKEVREKIAASKSEENGAEKKTFIRALVDDNNGLPEEEIQDEINTLILAAQDTSAIASSASLLLLAMHKDKQDKVVEELRLVFGTSTENLYIDIEQVNQLQYLDMVINEAMRLIPVVPIVFRQNETEITLSKGQILPAKSPINLPIYIIHREKGIWGDDADSFRPERFEEENIRKIHPYAFIPFAKGPRMCVGWRYAMILIKIQLANILLRYELDTSLKLHELEFKYNITINVCQGFKISIRDRKL